MKKYELRIRAPPSQQQKKQQATRPPLPPPAGFRDDESDDDAAERAASRQTVKSRALKVRSNRRKALEEDPKAFDYDGVYNEMKQQVAHPRAQDREDRREPKYILNLKKKAEERQREHEVVYERKIAKERSKEDHLYADKPKIVTGPYKDKVDEQDKWMEGERLRELREEKEDVTKKSDLTDFYFNLEKNVAYGSRGLDSKKPEKHTESSKSAEKKEAVAPGVHGDRRHLSPSSSSRTEPSRAREGDRSDIPSAPKIEPRNEPLPDDHSSREKVYVVEPSSSDQPKRSHRKRTEDIAAARERLLARKRAKESQYYNHHRSVANVV